MKKKIINPIECLGKQVVGWREWVSMPGICIPAMKAKLDTGARTSALHTFRLEKFREGGRRMVRFGIHPLQRRTDIEIMCEAEVVGERLVSDSGGHREKRLVIMTEVEMGGRVFEIELTLTNRDTMQFRLLIGRTAMDGNLIIDPERSFMLGRKIGRRYLKSIKQKSNL
jgi:hypothetical protein